MKYPKLELGTIEAVVNKLGGMDGVQRFLRGELTVSESVCAKQVTTRPKKIRKKYLKLISGGKNLVLDAVDGTKVIADATDVFSAGIDSDFRRWRADESGQPTDKTPVAVYEMKKDANFAQMVGDLNADTGKLCLSQHQILNFIERHKGWLRAEGYGTFFPFKSYGEFFVAIVNVRSGGLRVRVYRFED